MAVTVNINPNDYGGNWNVGGVWRTGSAALDLAPGSHQISIGGWGGFTFTVGTDGSISTSATSSAVATGNTLSLVTTPVTIATNQYEGSWSLEYASALFQGTQTLRLVPGMRYKCFIGGWDGFLFSVDTNGAAIIESPGSAVATGNSISLLTTPVTIVTNDYAGSWWLEYASALFQGTQTLRLVPGIRYKCFIGGWDGFLFSVDISGTVTIESPGSAVATGNSISFLTTPVTIVTNNYVGSWSLEYASALFQGTQTLQLVPGIRYKCFIGGWGGFLFSVEVDGAVNTDATASAAPTGNVLSLLTVGIRIAPRDFSGAWSLEYASGEHGGTQTLQLVPDIQYNLQANGSSARFTVTAPCANVGWISVGGVDFEVSCNQECTATSDNRCNGCGCSATGSAMFSISVLLVLFSISVRGRRRSRLLSSSVTAVDGGREED